MTVLVAYKPTSLATAAARVAAEQAAQRGDRLIVLNAASGAAVADRALATSEQLEALRADLSTTHGLDVQVIQIRTGNSAAETILEVAEREAASLLVIGLRPRSPTGKFLLGSTAQTLLLRAPCNVLAVKADQGTSPEELA